jgi:hypothetical protein
VPDVVVVVLVVVVVVVVLEVDEEEVVCVPPLPAPPLSSHSHSSLRVPQAAKVRSAGMRRKRRAITRAYPLSTPIGGLPLLHG